MAVIRTFVAVETGADVRARASGLIKQLKAVQRDPKGVKWVEPQQMHLTLKFLGDVPDREVPQVCRVVQKAVAHLPPFDFVVRGAGAFPALDNPRTIWLGVEEGSEGLAACFQAVDEALADLGYPRENRRFTPHLTLGRVKREATEFRELLQTHADFEAGVTDVDEIVVFSSFLDRGGPTYSTLGRAQLAAEM